MIYFSFLSCVAHATHRCELSELKVIISHQHGQEFCSSCPHITESSCAVGKPCINAGVTVKISHYGLGGLPPATPRLRRRGPGGSLGRLSLQPEEREHVRPLAERGAPCRPVKEAARARGRLETWRGGPRPPAPSRRTGIERRPMWWRGSRNGQTTTCVLSGYRRPAGRAGGGRGRRGASLRETRPGEARAADPPGRGGMEGRGGAARGPSGQGSVCGPRGRLGRAGQTPKQGT